MPKPGEVTLQMYSPTVGRDFQLVKEMAGSLDRFENVKAEVLLLGGSKSPKYLKNCLAPLQKILPHARRVEMRGVGHGKY